MLSITRDALEARVEVADGASQFRIAVPLLDLIQDGVDLALAGPAALQLQGLAQGCQFRVLAVLVAFLGVAHQFA